MAKKLIDIENYIKKESNSFLDFFYSNISIEVQSFIMKLETVTNVFLFSGIIRDYFLNKSIKKYRDVDLIIEDDIKIEDYFKNINYKKNNYGGYKIEINNTLIDLWVIKNTWALNQGQLKLEFSHLYELPKTTFFNFSSILYSLKYNEFIIGKDFLRFLRDKKIELVLDKNPHPELCIVNSFYYSEKLKIELGDKLKNYLENNFTNYSSKIESIQLKHFGKIIYSLEDIESKIKNLQLTKNIVHLADSTINDDGSNN